MATFTWLGGSGNWTDNNWSITGAAAQSFPTSTDIALVGGTGAYTLTVSGAVQSVHDLTLTDPNAVLQFTAVVFGIVGGLTIDAGTLSFESGSGVLDASSITNDGALLFNGLGAVSGELLGRKGFVNRGPISVDGDRVTLATLSSNFTNTGTIAVANFGSLDVLTGGTLLNSGLMTLSTGATIDLNFGSGQTASPSGFVQFLDDSAAVLSLGQVFGTVTTTVEDFRGGNVIDLTNTLMYDPTETATVQGNTIVVSRSGAVVLTIPVAGVPESTPVAVSNNGLGWAELTACFIGGTRLLTGRGEAEVETLAAGDKVVTLGRHGPVLKPIVWIGCSRFDARRHPRPHEVLPIRITAGALGDRLPHRDLIVSPGHCLLLDGVLIQAERLINGCTIVRDTGIASGEYFHIELAQHDILLSEGVPSESYLDTGNRSAFANCGQPPELHPNFGPHGTETCRPLVQDGPILAAARQRIAARAEQRGWRLVGEPEPQILADGRAIAPLRHDGTLWTYRIERAATLRLRSWATSPSELVAHSEDRRRLGLCVSAVAVATDAARRALELDCPALSDGWHAVEHAPDGRAWRWTDGDASLAIAGPCLLEITIDSCLAHWEMAPGQAAAKAA